MTAPRFASALPDPAYQEEFYASVPSKRAMAWVVDMIVTALMTAVIVPFTAFTALFFLPFLYLIVSFFYRWITISSGSATWGMRLMGVEFRRADGAQFDAGTALIHTLGFVISFSMVMPQLISIGLMLFTDRKQGLTDLVLGTVAINRVSQY